MANHFPSNAKFFSIDFLAASSMPPLGPCVDLLGDGSFCAISAPGHTDDDMAFLINSATPLVLLTKRCQATSPEALQDRYRSRLE